MEFHAAGAQSSDAHGELSQKQQINFSKVVKQYVGEVDKSIIVVLQINSVWCVPNTIIEIGQHL